MSTTHQYHDCRIIKMWVQIIWNVGLLYFVYFNITLMLQNLQGDQLQKISELQGEVMRMRRKHSEALQQLKAQFLKEKHMCQQESEHKITSMSKQANKVQIMSFI